MILPDQQHLLQSDDDLRQQWIDAISECTADQLRRSLPGFPQDEAQMIGDIAAKKFIDRLIK